MFSSYEEHRISPRKALRTRVIFEDELNEEFLYFLSTDISLSGIFIESDIELQSHTKLFLKFSLYEGDAPIQVTGEVIRIQEPPHHRGRRKKQRRTQDESFPHAGAHRCSPDGSLRQRSHAARWSSRIDSSSSRRRTSAVTSDS